MQKKTKKRWLIVANIATVVLPIIIVTWVWYGTPSKAEHSCVDLHVDYGISADIPVYDVCVPEFEKANAYGLAVGWGFSYIGTKTQGPAVICRVATSTHYAPSIRKPLPVPGHMGYIERCLDKPASFAHWAVIIKRAQHGNAQAVGWRYTNKKLWEIDLKPGDGVGLVFVVNHKLVLPTNKVS
jgi:hypothetical protein